MQLLQLRDTIITLLFTIGRVSCKFAMPVHCHLLYCVSQIPYNDIIFSNSTTKQSVLFFIYLLFGNHSWQPKRVHFIFFLTTNVFVMLTHSDKLQLPLVTPSKKPNHLTTKIKLTRPRVKRMGVGSVLLAGEDNYTYLQITGPFKICLDFMKSGCIFDLPLLERLSLTTGFVNVR